MKKLLLTTITTLSIIFGQSQTTFCDSLTITGSQFQLQITINNLNTPVYYWETMGYDGTILEQDSSMSTTHNVYNFNMSTGQNYDTLVTCISTMNTYCCATLFWNGNNWISFPGSNPPPLNCNANFYWWQNFDSTNNAFTNQVYCVENSTGGAGPYSYNWVFGDGNTSNLQYPTHIYNQVGDYNLCLTYTDASGCSSNYCDTITISSRNGYTLNVIDESQIATLGIEKMEIISGIKIFPNPINNQSYVEINTNQNLETFINYLDYSGKVIKSQKINLFKGLNKIPINSEELNSGIYFLNFNYDDQKLNKTIKILK